MQKIISILLAVLVVSIIAATGVIAQENPNASSKVTAECSATNLIDETEATNPVGEWHPILWNTIKTPNQKDLFIDVSLESGLYTRTLVKSKRNFEGDPDWDSSTAHAKIDVRVVIDPGTENEREAYPGPVTFNSREQTLSAKFMGIFTGECLIVEPAETQLDNDGDGDVNEDKPDGKDNDGDGLIDEDWIEYVITIDYDCLEPEELELILNTMSANAFNFLIDDLTPGVHTVEVQAQITTNGSAEEGEFEAMATVGKGSMTVEEVRFIQDENIVMP